MAKSTSKKSMKWSNGKLFGIGLIAALLLIIANSAFWANNYLFNTANFSRVSTEAITSESSRLAVATGLTARIFADRPVALQVVGDTSVKFISGLLGSQQFSSAIAKATARLQNYVTSENQESVVINLEGVKQVMTTLIALSDREGQTRITPDQIPNEVVLVDADDFPNYYSQGLALLWIGPLALIGAGVILAWPYVKKRADTITTLGLQGAALLAGGAMALLIGPLFRPMVLASANTPTGRTVLENIYNAFISTFNTQTMWLIMLAIVAVLTAALLWFRQSRKTS